MGELVKRLREAANGLETLKSERGDFGLCDEAADRIEALEAENARLLDAVRFATEKLEEINPSNYDHENVCSLNAASVEAGLYLDAVLRAAQEDKV